MNQSHGLPEEDVSPDRVATLSASPAAVPLPIAPPPPSSRAGEPRADPAASAAAEEQRMKALGPAAAEAGVAAADPAVAEAGATTTAGGPEARE